MRDIIKPFLKWAGGKSKLVSTLKKFFPEGKRFVEPFLGAGAVSLNVDYPSYLVNDTNADLMLVWRIFKDKGMEFVAECEKLFIPENFNKDTYNALRQEFNTTKDKMRKAILFIYLNRHCFNGLCRYNAQNHFNVPIGKYPASIYFPKKEFTKCHDRVIKFEMHNADFREIFKLVQEGDVVYCDPPYLPISESANFDDYAAGGFTLRDQIDLAAHAQEATKKGATVVILIIVTGILGNYTRCTMVR